MRSGRIASVIAAALPLTLAGEGWGGGVAASRVVLLRGESPHPALPRRPLPQAGEENTGQIASRLHPISRRAFVGGALAVGLGSRARAQGFAGLGETADGFAAVVPGKNFVFPLDHGPHPEFRIEWWYVTANLTDATGAAH